MSETSESSEELTKNLRDFKGGTERNPVAGVAAKTIEEAMANQLR